LRQEDPSASGKLGGKPVKIECECRVCCRFRKIKGIHFIAGIAGLQIQIDMKCGHTEIFQLKRMPLGAKKI
jgi:hypothetical protein